MLRASVFPPLFAGTKSGKHSMSAETACRLCLAKRRKTSTAQSIPTNIATLRPALSKISKSLQTLLSHRRFLHKPLDKGFSLSYICLVFRFLRCRQSAHLSLYSDNRRARQQKPFQDNRFAFLTSVFGSFPILIRPSYACCRVVFPVLFLRIAVPVGCVRRT